MVPVRFRAYLASAVSASALAACATQAVAPPPVDSVYLVRSGDSDRRRVDILPLLDMNWDEGSSDDLSQRYVGGYTRFHVIGDLPQGEEAAGTTTVRSRRYNAENRGPLARWLVGQSISRVVSIRVHLTQPDVSATTTLAAASQESNRTRGESWATEIHGRRMLTPYFRVDATTVATVEANLNASSAIQGDVSGAFIDVLSRAASLLAPSTTLVTSLTEERLGAASDFIDQSISTLFAQTLAEKSASEFRPADWSEQLVTLTARFPLDRSVANDQKVEEIGSWTVAVEPAIVSIFNTTPLCAPMTRQGNPAPSPDCSPLAVQQQAGRAFQGLAPHTVLNFKLDQQQTLVQAIRGDEAIARALDTLTRTAALKAGTERTAAQLTAARVLCNLVAGKAEALGFNRFDAAATVWAVGFSDLISNNDGTVLTDRNTCISADLAGVLGLSGQTAIDSTLPSEVAERAPGADDAGSVDQNPGSGRSAGSAEAAGAGQAQSTTPAQPQTSTTASADLPVEPPNQASGPGL